MARITFALPDIGPAVSHGSASECGGQTGHRGAVSNTGLLFQRNHAQSGAKRFHQQVIVLVGVGAAADHAHRCERVNGAAFGVLLPQGAVAGFLEEVRDAVDGPIPRLLFPMVAARRAIAHVRQTAVVNNVLLERDALGAQAALVDGVVGIALHMHHRRPHVLALVAQRVDDYAAAHRTIRAGGAGFGGARDFQLARLGVGGRQIEAERGRGHGAGTELEEGTPGGRHRAPPMSIYTIKCGAESGVKGPSEHPLVFSGYRLQQLRLPADEIFAWLEPPSYTERFKGARAPRGLSKEFMTSLSRDSVPPKFGLRLFASLSLSRSRVCSDVRTLVPILIAAVLLPPGMHAANAPAFNVSPSNLYMSAVAKGTAPSPQVIVVNNTVAGSILKWRASLSGSGAAYCAVSPSQGTLVGQSAVMFSVSASVPAVGGSYQCTVTLSDNGSSPPAANGPSTNVRYGVYGKGTTLPPSDTTPPNVPQYLSVAATGLSTVGFNWYSSGDPANRYVAGYAVYRDGTQIAVTGLR